MITPNKTGKRESELINSQSKQSVLFIADSYILDLYGASRSTQNLHKKTNSNISSRRNTERSYVFNTQNQSRGVQFLARKLKRITNKYLTNVFKKLRNYRVPIINLNLLNKMTKRSLAAAFFTLRFFVQMHKGQRLQQVITKNRRPNLLCQFINRIIKRNQKQVIKLLRNNTSRSKNIQTFVLLFQKSINSNLKQKFKRLFLRNIKINHVSYICKKESAKQIFRHCTKICFRHKLQAFQHIIMCIKTTEYEKISLEKKQMSGKFTQQHLKRNKSLQEQRAQVRNIKYTIDNSAADRSKTRYQLKRDLYNLKTKIKQEQKSSKILTGQLISQNSKLQQTLAQLQKLNSKRSIRRQKKITKELVKNIYKSIYQQKSNQIGQIKLKMFTKQMMARFRTEIQNIDQFHSFRNQKLRQQICEYQNLQVYNSEWPQEQQIEQQNKNLKQMVQCLIYRCFDNFIHQDVLKNQENVQNE